MKTRGINFKIGLIITFHILLSMEAISQMASPIKLKLPKRVVGLGVNANEDEKFHFYWILAKNSDEASEIWTKGNRWTFLNMTSISGTQTGGTASVDIISDYAGPVRVALLGNVSSALKDSLNNNEQNIERFFSGGGTAVLVVNFIGPTLTWKKNGYIMINVIPKLGFDFPAMGASSSTSTSNLDSGIERLNYPLTNNNLGFFGNLRQSYTMGGSDFYSQLNLSSSNPFSYTLMNVGVSFPGMNIAILYTKVLSGPNVVSSYNQNARISIVISPKIKS